MLKLSDLKNKAKQLTEKAERLVEKNQSSVVGCFNFFPAAIPETVIHDMRVIKAVADSLDGLDECSDIEKLEQTKIKRDLDLIGYLQGKKIHSLLQWDEFLEYKTKILIGCYLLKYEQYNELGNTVDCTTIINWLQSDLGIDCTNPGSEEERHSCLDALKQYCSFVYEQKNHDENFAQLNRLLGDSIQADIHRAMHPMKTANPLLFDVFHLGMEVIGLKMNNV